MSALDLGPLPEPYATSVTWRNPHGGSWQQWHDREDPMPTVWDGRPPDEVVRVYTADQMRSYAAGVAAGVPATVARQALEALKEADKEKTKYMKRKRLGDPSMEPVTLQVRAAIAALRAALASPTPPAADPLAWVTSSAAPPAPTPPAPLKARPDFIAGYDAGLADGRRCAERDAAPTPPTEPTMADAIAAGGGTLHGAIDYWQERALKAEAAQAAEPAPAKDAP